MAPVPLAKLVLLQTHRDEEIKQIGKRMRERSSVTLNRSIIQSRVETINELWSQVRATHTDIAIRVESQGDPYVTESRFQSMQLSYEDTLDWLLTALTNFSSDKERHTQRSERTDEDLSDRPAKLPCLDLPTISGKYEDWDSFADIFSTLVHEAPRIADTTKLQYLKLCLKGPAADLVKDVTILGVNYESIWRALRDRFYNPRLTINKLLDALTGLPYLKKESAVELRAFVDETRRIIRALTNLRPPVVHWDVWLVHTLEVRLDPESRKMWESELVSRDREISQPSPNNESDHASRFPKFVDLAAFLERRAQSLSIILSDKDDKRAGSLSSVHSSSRKIHHARPLQAAAALKCVLCSENHFIARCPTFVAKRVYDRQNDVRHLNLCFNCLGRHRSKNCSSSFRCKFCKEEHHTLLHFKRSDNRETTDSKGAPSRKVEASSASDVRTPIAHASVGSEHSVSALKTSTTKGKSCILLATARVTILGPYGKRASVRALLDQGAEASFVSESLVQLIGLKRDRIQTGLTGIGRCKARVIKHATSFVMQSKVNADFKLEINAFVLPRLTSEFPGRNLVELDTEQFNDLSLADPKFNISGRIDLIIGADTYGQLLLPGLRSSPNSMLVAQNTALGWVVSGPTQKESARRAVACDRSSTKSLQCAVNDDLSEIIQRFWTLEEVAGNDKRLKPIDEACERLFEETHVRDSDGRFIVRLPLRAEPPSVGIKTRGMALSCLRHQQQ